MSMPIHDWIEEHRDEFVRDMMDFFSIESVSLAGEGKYPFGDGCKKMLDFALERSRELGLRTENHEDYCGSALLDGKEKTELGMFSHLDVVPAGDGWATPPYEPVIKDGWIYARGSSDNKGPAVACLYALRYLKEMGISLKHTVRLYYGCNEEVGMADILYYREHYPIPAFSFAPDASFPVCAAEKGVLEGTYSRDCAGNLLSFEAGTAENSVPDKAEAVIKADLAAAQAYFAGKPDFAVSVAENFAGKQDESGIQNNAQNNVCIEATGKTAHAATPEGSENAAVKLAKTLSDSGLLDEAGKECLRYIWEPFEDIYGNGFGVAYKEELSGALTVIEGTVHTGDGKLFSTLNIRYPASVNQQNLIHQVNETAGRYGWKREKVKNNSAYSVDLEDEKIKRMVEISSRVWNRDWKPYAMGGGTYARKLKNAVAYGPGILDQKKPGYPNRGRGHQPDECVCIGNMMKAVEIYTEALMMLDEMVE